MTRQPPGEGREDGAIDVLCFGEALVDFFPGRPGLSLVDAEVFHRHLGGAPANVAVGLARCGARVALMTLVGPDDFGRFVRRALAAEGVDCGAVGVHPTAKTGVTFVSVGARGERSFMFFRHPSADQMIAPADVDVARIERACVFHLGSSTLSREPARAATLSALAAAETAGRVISCDPNFRPHLWDDPAAATPLLRSLVARSHVVKIADDELRPIVGTDDVEAGARALRALGAQLVVVTLGARGCYYEGPCGRGALPAESVAVVDSTGAGDGFVAGMLATLCAPLGAGATIPDLDDVTVRAALARGNHLGALAVSAMGATTGIPTPA